MARCLPTLRGFISSDWRSITMACKIIRPKKNADEDDFRLRFIQSGIMKTPDKLGEMTKQDKMFDIFKEHHRWQDGDIMHFRFNV